MKLAVQKYHLESLILYKSCNPSKNGVIVFFTHSLIFSVLRPFVKSEFVIGQDAQIEVKFRSKYRKGRTNAYPRHSVQNFMLEKTASLWPIYSRSILDYFPQHFVGMVYYYFRCINYIRRFSGG